MVRGLQFMVTMPLRVSLAHAAASTFLALAAIIAAGCQAAPSPAVPAARPPVAGGPRVPRPTLAQHCRVVRAVATPDAGNGASAPSSPPPSRSPGGSDLVSSSDKDGIRVFLEVAEIDAEALASAHPPSPSARSWAPAAQAPNAAPAANSSADRAHAPASSGPSNAQTNADPLADARSPFNDPRVRVLRVLDLVAFDGASRTSAWDLAPPAAAAGAGASCPCTQPPRFDFTVTPHLSATGPIVLDLVWEPAPPLGTAKQDWHVPEHRKTSVTLRLEDQQPVVLGTPPSRPDGVRSVTVLTPYLARSGEELGQIVRCKAGLPQ